MLRWNSGLSPEAAQLDPIYTGRVDAPPDPCLRSECSTVVPLLSCSSESDKQTEAGPLLSAPS